MLFTFGSLRRAMPDVVVLGLIVLVQAAGLYLLRRRYPSARRPLWALSVLSGALLATGFFLRSYRVAGMLPPAAVWIRGAAIAWAMISGLWLIGWGLWRLLAMIWPAATHDPLRRSFLRATAATAFALPAAAVGY